MIKYYTFKEIQSKGRYKEKCAIQGTMLKQLN